MMESWLSGNRLVSEPVWVNFLNGLKSNEEVNDKDEIIKKLSEKLIGAIKKRVPEEKFGVFFSGGIDSTLISFILKKLNATFVCYTVGFQEGNDVPRDIKFATIIAEELGLNLKYKLFNLKEAEDIFKEVILVLNKVGKSNVVTVGVGAVILAAARLANVNFFFSGLGSEELYAGYDRHAKVIDVQEECWSGLFSMYGRDLVRDAVLASYLNIGVATPFLDEDIVGYSMQIPGKFKISSDFKKVILREMAESLGLPKEFAWRKKQAAQYGSSFDKALKKLAKKSGLSKKGWIEAQ